MVLDLALWTSFLETHRPHFRVSVLPGEAHMESYVMRTFSNDWPEFGRVASYELDMPALSGMSGAPIIRVGSREVIGVLYGRNDAETIEEFSSRDPETGARTPEVVRMTSFAVAHFTDTLRELRGQATQNLPLAEYLIT